MVYLITNYLSKSFFILGVFLFYISSKKIVKEDVLCYIIGGTFLFLFFILTFAMKKLKEN